MPKLATNHVIHARISLALPLLWALRLVSEELLRLKIADLPLEYLEIGHFIMVLPSFLFLTAVLPLGSQHYLASSHHPWLGFLCLGFDPALAFLRIPQK